MEGCIRNGIDAQSANKIFDEMAEFAKYAFNKSHAACYAVIAYRTAYLKAYYPSEFMAATLNSFLGDLDKIPAYIEECKTLGIQILKPTINKSYTKFSVENNNIRFGLGSIKNVGIQPVNNIIRNRKEKGGFLDFINFLERMVDQGINKKCIESLIKAGAFDEFNITRSTLLASFETMIDIVQSDKRKSQDGQMSIFDLMEENKEDMNIIKYKYVYHNEIPKKELLSLEKEMLGIYISGHPLENIKEFIESKRTIAIKDIITRDEENIKNIFDGHKVTLVGIINSVTKKFTKTNKMLAIIGLEDLEASMEILAFDSIYQNASNLIKEENIIIVEGRLNVKEDSVTIFASSIKGLETEEEMTITVDITNIIEAKKEELRDLIRACSKTRNAVHFVQVKIGEEIRPCGKIFVDDNILHKLEEIVANKNIEIIKKNVLK